MKTELIEKVQVYMAKIKRMYAGVGDTVLIELDSTFLPFEMGVLRRMDHEVICKDLRIGDTVEFSVAEPAGLPEYEIHRFVPELRMPMAERGFPRNMVKLNTRFVGTAEG